MNTFENHFSMGWVKSNMAGWGPEFANWPLWRVDASSVMTITSENAWKIKLCEKIPPPIMEYQCQISWHWTFRFETCWITSFTPFGRSGRVTHATVQWWNSAFYIFLFRDIYESGQVYCIKPILPINCNILQLYPSEELSKFTSHSGVIPQYNGRASVVTGQNI